MKRRQLTPHPRTPPHTHSLILTLLELVVVVLHLIRQRGAVEDILRKSTYTPIPTISTLHPHRTINNALLVLFRFLQVCFHIWAVGVTPEWTRADSR